MATETLMVFKTCPSCIREYPATPQYFYPRRDRKSGLSSWCRACRTEHNEAHRNKGIGTKLLDELFALAKETFKIEIVHLEVYHTNPAIILYQRLGFKQFGNFLMGRLSKR